MYRLLKQSFLGAQIWVSVSWSFLWCKGRTVTGSLLDADLFPIVDNPEKLVKNSMELMEKTNPSRYAFSKKTIIG